MSGSTHFAIVQAVAYELPENNEKWDFNHIIDDGEGGIYRFVSMRELVNT